MIRSRDLARPAFTLPEMLVVMAIITTLVAFSAAVILKFGSSQQSSTTRTLMQRLDSQLRRQMTTVADAARAKAPGNSANTMAGGDPQRAKVIHLKLQIKQRFPTTYSEALNPTSAPDVPVVPAYVNYLKNFGITTATLNLTNPVGKEESAACLLMVLSVGQDAVSQSELGPGSVKTLDVTNSTTGAEVPCLADAWGEPLTFCRWPTGDPTGVSGLNPKGAQTGNNDPGDPMGLLQSALWASLKGSPPPRTLFTTLVHQLPASGSVKLTPVIVSSGADKQLGCDPVTLAVTNQTQANDNIYSTELR